MAKKLRLVYPYPVINRVLSVVRGALRNTSNNGGKISNPAVKFFSPIIKRHDSKVYFHLIYFFYQIYFIDEAMRMRYNCHQK